ncbi:metallophosphoesterase [Rhizobium leguminosarum]|uniref:metallophosphoesterase n=1 Tax=Rhizobium leguminosarum TaxID=384 RepID=UPI00131A2905|nr:metallophosphoesterase [Rhizobium leguminosarum]
MHLEVGRSFEFAVPTGADVIACAGDVTTRGVARGIQLLASRFGDQRVVFIAGNHDYWGAALQSGISDARQVAERYPSINFLENECMV